MSTNSSNLQQSTELKKLSYDEFMELMLSNIVKNKKRFSGKVVFESETKNVSCFVCPYARDEEKVN